MPSANDAHSSAISAGGSMLRISCEACWKIAPRSLWSWPVRLAVTRSWIAAASVQNSESAWGAVFSVVSLALELELDEVVPEDEVSSFDPPPQAVSRTAAAAATSPPRQRERVRRMVGRLAALRAPEQAPGYGAGRGRPGRPARNMGSPAPGRDG